MKTLKKPFENLLKTFAFLVAGYFFIRVFLAFFGLQFRAWINVIWVVTTGLTFVAGLIQKASKTEDKKVQLGISSVFLFGLLMICMPILPYILASEIIEVVPLKEDVIEMDGHKLIASHNLGFMDPEMNFYEYKNFMFSGVHCVYHGWGYDTDQNGEIYLYWDEETIYDVNEILD
jgi:hypothetical protein